VNGAERLLETLVESGVELCLFEGVVSGAADGYARMVDKPATLVAPANHAWEEAARKAQVLAVPEMETVSATIVADVAQALSNGKNTALYLGGRALREESLEAAGRYCLPGSQGHCPASGWQRDVYRPGPVVNGAGKYGHYGGDHE
jgi:thiamine pyrophosphate-dependent acetolactate synthase large subunit-like protein